MAHDPRARPERQRQAPGQLNRISLIGLFALALGYTLFFTQEILIPVVLADGEVDDPGELPRPRATGEVAQVGAFAAITYEALSWLPPAWLPSASEAETNCHLSPTEHHVGSGLPGQSGR
jgi:hypothetical protein